MTTQGVIARTSVRGNLSHDEVLYNVMLSSAKHLLAGYALCARGLLSALRRFFVTLRMTIWGTSPPLKTLKATVGSPLVLVPEGS